MFAQCGTNTNRIQIQIQVQLQIEYILQIQILRMRCVGNICIEQYKCNDKYKHKSKSNTNTNRIQLQILRMSCASNVCKEPNRWGSPEGFASPTIPDCQCQILYHCWHLPNKYCPPFDIHQTKYKRKQSRNGEVLP